ncbi:TROVE domain-containing protein [Phthorimaea operculella]|nr:TROVE domain-containing protein [Phthorimaea operculella]
MTEPPSPPKLDRQLRNQLERFLHTGNEVPKYFPGCWASHKYFTVDKLQTINTALANGTCNLEVVQTILKAYKDGWYTRFETIAFALTKCLLLGTPAVKEATYKAAAVVCNTPEELMTFNKFTRLLKTGNGRGWCKYVQEWYLKKDPMELAKEMTRVRSRHGRSHKTLIRKSHVKVPTEDTARDAVVKYAIFGLKRAKQMMGDKPGTKEIFEYIQKVEDMRHCEDPAAAATMAAQHRFTIDHVPGHLLTSQDVWNAILPQFTLNQLLYNILRIHNMGFLTNDSTTTAILISLLNNQEVIQKSNITPLAVYITLCNYKKKSKYRQILPQFTLNQLLYNILRIHNMGFLTNDSTTTAILISLLNNQEVIQKSNITPLAVYITLCNYKKKSKPLKHEKAKVAAEKETRRRTRQIFDSKTGLWEWTVTRRHPKEVKNWGIDLPPNPAVIAALNKLMDQTWLLTPPTNARYMITLDMRHHMFKGRHFCKNYAVAPKKAKKVTAKPAPAPGAGGDADTEKKSKKHLLAECFYNKHVTPGHADKVTAKPAPAPGAGGDADTEKKSKKHLLAECFYNKHVTPGHAAIILALQILKREKNVKIAVFTEEGVETVAIERNFSSVEEAEFQLRKANLGRVQLDAPIEWAAKNKHKVDVFINMVDRTTRYMELDIKARGGRGPGGRYGPPPAEGKDIPDHCPVRALERYRNSAGVKDAKLITMSLASLRVMSTDGSHEGVLDIVGVDEHVPKVMDAFVRGAFK